MSHAITMDRSLPVYLRQKAQKNQYREIHLILNPLFGDFLLLPLCDVVVGDEGWRAGGGLLRQS